MYKDPNIPLTDKTKEELISMINQLRASQMHTSERSLDQGFLHIAMSNSRVPCIVLEPNSLEVIFQNSAADKIPNIRYLAIEELKQKKHYPQDLSTPRQWAICPYDESTKCYDLILEEAFSSNQRYLLLRVLRTYEKDRQIKVDLYQGETIGDLLKLTKNGIFYHDLKNSLTYLDDSHHTLLGIPYQKKPFTSEEIFKWVHPEKRKEVLRALNHVILFQEPVTLTASLVSPTNERSFDVVIRYVPNTKLGEIVGIWGVLIDITSLFGVVSKVDSPEALYFDLNKNFYKRDNILNVIESTSKIAWWYYDRNSNEHSISKNWPDFFNIDEDKSSHLETYLDIVHPDDRDTLRKLPEITYQGARYATCSYRLINFNPIKYVYAINIAKGNDIYGIVQDITELKGVKSSLQALEKKYKDVVELQEELVCRFKPDTTLTFVNKAYCRFFNTSESELIGTKFIDLISEEKHNYILGQLEKAKKSKSRITNVHQTFEKNGVNQWLRWTDCPIFDEDGNLVEFQTSGIVVTDTILAENKLKESEEKYKMIAENSNDVIYFLDKNLKLSYVNSSVKKMLGYTKDEFLNLPYDKFLTHDALSKVKEVTERRKQNESRGKKDNKTRTWIMPLICKSGKIIWGEVVTTPIRDKSEKFAGIVGIIRDISIRKRYEDRLISNNRELQDLIEEKNKFLSMISHDLKSPLNAIQGMVYLLKNNINPIPHKEILNTLDFSSRHLKALVNNLLDLASLKNNKIILNQRPFNLSELLKNTANAFTPLALDKHIKFNFTHENVEGIVINGDPDRFTQILNNLFSNAFKFTERGSVNFHAKLDTIGKDTCTVSLIVEDTGIGIEDHNLRKIFDPFTKVGAKFKEGSGIGLAILKELVDLYQGSVSVSSEYGKGTAFKVVLSFAYQKLDRKSEKTKTQVKSNSNLQGVSVLYIEDLEYNQKLMHAYSQLWQFDLSMVKDAETGIQCLKSNKFNVVLMDILLPGMDGHQATKMIRSYEKRTLAEHRNVILAVTANESKSIEWYNSHGFDDVIYKPFDHEQLRAKLLQWSRGAQSYFAKNVESSYDLFGNLKTAFKKRPESLIQTLTSFCRDLEYQKKVFIDALANHDAANYKKARHNSIAMLAMMNEIELLKFLNANESIPEESTERIKLREVVEERINKLKVIITSEIDTIKKLSDSKA